MSFFFPLQPDRPEDAVRVIIHGGARKGDPAGSSPDPVPERGGFVIEIAADDMHRIDPALHSRIDRVWLHDHQRLIRTLPDLLWHLPNLSEISLTDSRLNAQLFKRGLPDGVTDLSILGTGRVVPKGPANPSLQRLDALMREFHPRLDAAMFPNLEGLQVHIGRKSDKKDRREMWDVIQSFPNLTALGLAPADDALDWASLTGLTRLWLGNGDLSDLSRLAHMTDLTFLHLHHLKALETLDGIEALPNLTDLVLIGCDRLDDLSALERMPNLKYLHAFRPKLQDIGPRLIARGVTIQGWR